MLLILLGKLPGTILFLYSIVCFNKSLLSFICDEANEKDVEEGTLSLSLVFVTDTEPDFISLFEFQISLISSSLTILIILF